MREVEICRAGIHNDLNQVGILEVFLNHQVRYQLWNVVLQVFPLSGSFEVGIDSLFG